MGCIIGQAAAPSPPDVLSDSSVVVLGDQMVAVAVDVMMQETLSGRVAGGSRPTIPSIVFGSFPLINDAWEV